MFCDFDHCVYVARCDLVIIIRAGWHQRHVLDNYCCFDERACSSLLMLAMFART